MRGANRRAIKEYLWEYRKLVIGVAGVLTAVGLVIMAAMLLRGREVKASSGIQSGIADEIIRFHVLANSDSDADQALKIKVKDQVVRYLEPLLAEAKDVSETRARIQANLADIAEYAAQVVKENGYIYEVDAELTNCYFPMKSYGDCTFPAGNYEALRICIGAAKGQNWWCVLYPNLCFVDSVHAVVPEEQKQELKNILTEDEYDSLFDWKESEYRITTKWFGNNK